MNKKIEIQKFNKTMIYFEGGVFSATFAGVDFEDKTLDGIIQKLSDSSFKEEEGNYFTVSYYGLRPAKALRSFFDKWSGKEKVVIEEKDQYGKITTDHVERKKLKKSTPALEKAYQEQLQMERDGWAMINRARNLWKRAE